MFTEVIIIKIEPLQLDPFSEQMCWHAKTGGQSIQNGRKEWITLDVIVYLILDYFSLVIFGGGKGS